METLNFEKLKTDIYRDLMARVDLEKLSRLPAEKGRPAVAAMIQEIAAATRVPFNQAEREQLQADLLDEVFGLGPLEPLLRDLSISDILVNNKNDVFI